jgi:nucleolar GTP-binding protein
MTKCDIIRPEELPPEERAMIDSMAAPNVELTTMSAITGEGVAEVKASVCARLRAMRIDAKRTPEKLMRVEAQLTIARPPIQLEPIIPPSVYNPQGLGHPTQREREEDAGGPGLYVPDTREERDLAVEDWKYDEIPEILDGANVADFIDPNIHEKLEQLLREEEVRLAEYEQEKEAFEATKWAVAPDQDAMAALIRERRELILQKARMHRTSKVSMPETTKVRTKTAVAQKVNEFLEARGVDDATRERAVQEVMGQKPTRVPRVIEKAGREAGVQKRGPGERFDFYVKKNHVLQPKHMFSGKTGFKRDFK